MVAGSNGELTFAEVNENLSGRPVYQTADGGVFKFDFASDSINISNGLLGELKNYDGAMYFLTDGMKYLGKLTNGRGTDTSGEAYFWADTTLKESVVLPFLSTIVCIPETMPSTVTPPTPLGPDAKLLGDI